jgi:hypothetical protein
VAPSEIAFSVVFTHFWLSAPPVVTIFGHCGQARSPYKPLKGVVESTSGLSNSVDIGL